METKRVNSTGNTTSELPAQGRSINGDGVVPDPQHTGLGYEEFVEEYEPGVEPRDTHVRDTHARENQTRESQGLHVRPAREDGSALEPLRHIGAGDRPHEPSLGELVSGLSDDVTTLMRKEMELAVAEIQENVKEATRAGMTVTVAGFLGYAGLILLLIAVSLLLGSALNSMWMGIGIVGLVVVVIAAVLYGSGKAKLEQVNLLPRRTMRSVERDIEMAKEKLS